MILPKLIKTSLITCLLVLSASQTRILAEDDKSLVESALDLPGTSEPSPAPTQKNSSVLSNSRLTGANSEAKPLQPIMQFSNSTSSKSQTSASLADPENAKLQAPPIHSILPYSESKYFGMKLGKTHSVDPTYRGTPVLPTALPTVTVGQASWAPQRKIAAAPLPKPVSSPVLPSVGKNGIDSEKRDVSPQFSTVNIRFLTIRNFKPTDVVYAYPYPVKPPKLAEQAPMPEGERQLKDMILSSGYSNRIDLSRPYPYGGYRWIRVFETALKKSGTHMPHTMITVYPWVNKMFPYVLSECRLMNTLEEDRKDKYLKTVADYERLNAEMESKAASEGLVPIPVKVNSNGIGQASLPSGSWWLTATRRLPGLKFYWQVPVKCSSGEAINVQLTEANALLIQGGW